MWRFYAAYLVYTWGTIHRYYGIAHSVPREFSRAAHYFRRAFEIDPSFRQARLDYAIMLGRELGQPKEATAVLDELIADDEKYAEALMNRAMLLQQTGKFAGALSDWERYLALPHNDYQDLAQRTADLLRDLLQQPPAAAATP